MMDDAHAPALRPLFVADWLDVLFIHFRVDRAELQSQVPLDLDVYDGSAYISIVAFTQARLRPAFGGRVAEWMSQPLATHDFLNVRTYVQHGDEHGIYFLSEWIPNRLAVFLGPRLYGLPYRLGELEYSIAAAGKYSREVHGEQGSFRCHATVDLSEEGRRTAEGSEAEFLLERYTAFTCRHHRLSRFRIWHEAWEQVAARVNIEQRSLIESFVSGPPCSAHFSKGAKGVAISRPERIETNTARRPVMNISPREDCRLLH